MNDIWPRVTLGEVLHLVIEAVKVDPLISYPIAGVYSFGRGLLARSPILGTETTYNILHRLHSNDFVLSQLKGWEGAIARVPERFDGWFLSPQFPTFRAVSDQLDIAFLDWYCKQAKVWEELKNKSRGMGARRDSVSPAQFLSLRIPLPPLQEQRRVVARIEELAGKIEEARGLRREAVEAAEAISHAYARKLLSTVNAKTSKMLDWLDPKRDGVQTGPFGAQLGSQDFTDAGIPILSIGNIQYSGLKLGDLKYVSEQKAKQLTRYTVTEGDILFARMGTVGRCCVVPCEAEGWLFNYHIIRVALDKSKVDPRYVHWSIQTSSDIEGYLNEKVRGATRQGVNSTIVSSLPVRIPELPEQQYIVAYLDDLQAKVDVLRKLQAETQAELDALMPSVLDRAFRGELV